MKRQSAFTLIELIVAAVIATTALIGVYGLLQQAMHIERAASQRFNDRAAAEAIASELATSIERAVQIEGVPPIVGAKDPDGVYRFTCMVGSPSPGGLQPLGLIRRCRYNLAPGGKNSGGTMITRQALEYAGKKNISAFTTANGASSDNDPFAAVAPEMIAQSLGNVVVRFRHPGDETAKWLAIWSGDDLSVLVWIHAEAGNEKVDRFVHPLATAKLIGGEQ